MSNDSLTRNRPSTSRSSTTAVPTPRNWGRWWLMGWLLISAFFLLRGTGSSQQVPLYHKVQATKPIEQVEVGDRVAAGNPEEAPDLEFGLTVDPRTWQKIEMLAPKVDGTKALITLLRPRAWIENRGAVPGKSVPFEVAECGILGEAKVVSVGPCPPIRPGRGQIVTGTFHHQSAFVVRLFVEGEKEPIGTTQNHRFWSEDRQTFVQAGTLSPGERLRSGAGTPRVIRVEHDSRTEPVYNIEVQVDHVFHISQSGILVHNTAGRTIGTIPVEGMGMTTRGVVYTIRGTLNGRNYTYVGSTWDPTRLQHHNAEVTRLLQHGQNVEIIIRQVDLTSVAQEAAAEQRAQAQRVLRTAEQIDLNAELRRTGGQAYEVHQVTEVNGTETQNINRTNARSEAKMKTDAPKYRKYRIRGPQDMAGQILSCPR